MQDKIVSSYGGAAGRVLCSAFLPTTGLTAFVLAFLLVIEIGVFSTMKMPIPAVIVTWAIFLMATARLALNAFHGDWNGSILSLEGGSWKAVGAVAGRFEVLMLVWSAPLVLGSIVYATVLQASVGAMNSLNMAVPTPPLPLVIYGMSFFLFMPMALIVSVGAPGFASIFSKEYWVSVFSGRRGDIFVLCALSFGGPVMLYVAVAPALIAIASSGVQAMIAATGIFGGLLGAYWLTLFAKLCGEFARGSQDIPLAPAPHELPPTPRITSNGPLPQMAPMMAAPAALPPLPGPPAPIPIAGCDSLPPLPGPPAPIPIAGCDPVPPPSAAVGPPLLDVKERVARAQRRFESEPAAAIEELDALRSTFAPSPQLLHALALLLERAGDADRVLEVAKEAVPLCIERGDTEWAAEVFGLVIRQHQELQLSKEDLLALAGAFTALADLRNAARVHAMVIHEEPGETRAIKGLLQVAERMQRDPTQVDAAVKVYRFLLDRCADSPLAIYMQEGHDQAQRAAVSLASP